MRRGLQVLLICGVAGLISGCGSASKTKSVSPAPDFTLAASPSSLTLSAAGTAQAVSVSATALNGFSGTIQVAITGLPAGVTASPATLSLAPGTPQQVSFSAGSSAAAANASVQFVATAGTLSHSAALQLNVTTAPQPVGRDVVTYHYDVGRTGLNASEVSLTPANVNASQFGLLRVLAMDGKVDAQPLYLAGLTIGAQQRNVVFGASEHDSVYAFDADTGALIWKTSIWARVRRPATITAAARFRRRSGLPRRR